MISKAVVWFEEVTEKDIAPDGGKGANLAKMTNTGTPVVYILQQTGLKQTVRVPKPTLILKLELCCREPVKTRKHFRVRRPDGSTSSACSRNKRHKQELNQGTSSWQIIEVIFLVLGALTSVIGITVAVIQLLVDLIKT